VLILNKLLKTLGAQNYQNAGNAVLEYATSTRDLRENGVRTRSFFDLRKRQIGSLSASVFQARLRVTSGLTVIRPEPGNLPPQLSIYTYAIRRESTIPPSTSAFIRTFVLVDTLALRPWRVSA